MKPSIAPVMAVVQKLGVYGLVLVVAALGMAASPNFLTVSTLLHVVQPYPPMPEMGPVDVESVQDTQEQLATFQGIIGDVVSSNTMVRTGAAHVEIVAAAKELDIDLIVLSTHGRTGLAHVLLGSTAEKVVRHCGCPVLTVREHEREFVV